MSSGALHMVRTYAEAGVTGQSEMVAALVDQLRYRRRASPRMLGGIGAFSGLVEFGDHVLSLATDGVGTKLIVAEAIKKWDTIGIDCVAMNANDVVCANVEPVAFVDYLAIDRFDTKVAGLIGKGLNVGARRSRLSLVGGEIAVLPEVVRGFDLAGTCLGVARRDSLVTGEKIRVGDAIVGVASSGIHSNGLTLARRAFAEAGLSFRDRLPGGRTTVGRALLVPHATYVPQALGAFADAEVHGMAHITGGGVTNLSRLKASVRFEIGTPFRAQPVFRAIQGAADIDNAEMFRTFNMGMGLVVVTPPREVRKIVRAFRPFTAKRVGTVRRGRGVTMPSLDLTYSGYE